MADPTHRSASRAGSRGHSTTRGRHLNPGIREGPARTAYPWLHLANTLRFPMSYRPRLTVNSGDHP
jgi:hypothetical protein